jgi:hypothetical protein
MGRAFLGAQRWSAGRTGTPGLAAQFLTFALFGSFAAVGANAKEGGGLSGEAAMHAITKSILDYLVPTLARETFGPGFRSVQVFRAHSRRHVRNLRASLMNVK